MTPTSRKRPKKKRMGDPPDRRKRGDDYQLAVAQVAGSISPAAQVFVGTWVDGPDGRRDLDVAIRSVDGKDLLAVIECKDWNKPIGIAFIDALDSKRRDLGTKAALICSNSGFTADALRKAARVGIPTLAALIKGDSRIRVVIKQQVYTRLVTFARHGPRFHHQRLSEPQLSTLNGAVTREFTHEGESMEAWVAKRLLLVAGHATKSRAFVERVRFREPVNVEVRGLALVVTGIDIHAAFNVQWMTQVAQLNASQGMYDYLRQVVIFGPGQYKFDFTIDTETWGTEVDLDDVPPHVLVPLDQRKLPKHVQLFEIGMLRNMPQSDPKDAPDLDPLITEQEIVDDDTNPAP